MNGNSLLLDSNIILYLLGGDHTLVAILEEKQLCLSFISELELLSYRNISDLDAKSIKRFLKECIIVDINADIKEACIRLRKNHQLKLPDAIIVATAYFFDMPLLTADRDFLKVKEADIILYEK